MTQQNQNWWMQPPNYGVGASGQFNQTNPSMQPQQGSGGDQQAIIQRLMQLGANSQQIAQLGPQLMQLAQRGGLNGIDWGGDVRAAIMPQSQTRAPFSDHPEWGIQTPQQGGQGGLQPWMMPPQQGAPLGPAGGQQGIGGFQTPYGMGGGFSNGQASNGGPWWTDPYGNQSFSGFDWNQVVPWGNAQYTPGGPSPFAGQPVGAWEDITNNLRTMGYLDQQAFDQNQQGIQNNQWDRTFNANQGQQGIQNSQWDRNFAQQGSQWDRNFNANQAQQGIQNNQWDRTFGSNEAQRGWQNNFTQNEANRAADQWGQTFGANQAQQGWNNQYQTGRANAADSQWGQTFGANENQRGIENTRNAALDQWNQAFSQAGFDWRKQQDTEQNRLQDQGQNLAAFGRRFGPNVSYM